MKRTLCVMLCLVAGLVAFVSHCGIARAGEKITIAGGSGGGTWAVFAEGVSEAIRRGNPDYTVTTEIGKDGPNCMIINQGKVQVALAYMSTVLAALRGTEPYKKALPDMRNVANLALHGFHMLVTKKSGFTSVEEVARAVKEQKYPLKISVNKKGSLMEFLTKAALEANGVTYEDIEKAGGKVVYNIYPEALDMMSTNQLDGLGGISEFPTNFFMEAATRIEMRLLGLNEKAVEKINAQFSTMTYKVPPRTYSFQPDEVLTVASPLVVIASANLPEDQAYRIAKAIGTNLEFLRSVHVSLKSLDLKFMGASQQAELKFHPGAAKFYEESTRQ